MPSRHGLRPLKAWRYVGAFSEELMLCVAQVRIGPTRQSFWAVWDRAAGRLHERTVLGRGGVRLEPGLVQVRDRQIELALRFDEVPGVETVCPSGSAYAWTRKQGGIPVSGSVVIEGTRHPVEARAVIDDTAAYYPRHTIWRWSAGVGEAASGQSVAWNLVSGVNDPPEQSERTVWTDGDPHEVPPCRFADDLSSVDGLRFTAEAVRERRENLLVVRSRYRQPFGSFSGQLPGGIEVARGYGVMEAHDVWW
jgi:hypothetical protein